MKLYQIFLVTVILFIIAESLLVAYGQVKLYFFFFIPIFETSSFIGILPILLLLIPFVWAWREGTSPSGYAYGPSQPYTGDRKNNKRFGGFIMIGPIPILFGNKMDKNLLLILILIMVSLVLLWIVFIR